MDKYWIGGSSWWDYGTNWSTTGQPQNGDNVFLIQSDATNRTVSYYNTLYPSAVLNSMRIGAAGTGTMTLNQTSYNHPLAGLPNTWDTVHHMGLWVGVNFFFQV